MKKSEINNLIRGFGKIFEKKKNPNALKNILIEKLLKHDERVEIKEENYEGYLDNSNIIMVIPKIEMIKYLIEVNFEVIKKNKEDVKYMILAIKEEVKIKEKGKQDGGEMERWSNLYSSKYLNTIFNLTKNYENDVRIKMQKDSPVFIETPDFTIILAPRVENEENKK